MQVKGIYASGVESPAKYTSYVVAPVKTNTDLDTSSKKIMVGNNSTGVNDNKVVIDSTPVISQDPIVSSEVDSGVQPQNITLAPSSAKDESALSDSPSAQDVAEDFSDASDSSSSFIRNYPDYSDLLSQVQTIIDKNNAVLQANTQAQYEYNAQEAQKSRDWQEYMSNTAHQREVADLISAGLNPVLSVTGGSGASTPSGATASGSSAGSDTSAANVFGNYLQSLISSATQIMSSNINAKSAENVANLNNAMAYRIQKDFPNSTGALLSRAINGLLGGNTGGTAKSVGESFLSYWDKTPLGKYFG